MKVSKREKLLLYLVGAILVGSAYYQFIYVDQKETVKQKRAESKQLEKEYKEILLNVKTLDQRKAEEKIMVTDIGNKSFYFYPEIAQEKIILELDNLLTTSGLKGGLAFSPSTVTNIQYLTPVPEVLVGSSLQNYVDGYNNAEPAIPNTGGNAGTTVATAEQFKVAINFSGNYKDLKKFIAAIESYGRKISITDLSITPSNETDINGVLTLEFYAIPKIGDKDLDYLKWNLNNTYGKDVLFSAAAASGAYNSTVEQLQEEVKPNFIMLLKSPASELPTLTIGKANDSDRKTYLTADSDKVEDVTIEFNEDSDKLYYKYTALNQSYPKDNNPMGESIVISGDKIIVEITSEARIGNNDESGINLVLKNNTNKTVELIIKNDDNTNPRVTVTSEGNTVNVTKR